jgi:hypothetical protein
MVVSEGVAVDSRGFGLRAGEGVDCLEELGAVERFQGEPGEARSEAARADFDERMRGESDDGQGTAQGAELASGRFSVEDRHLQVHEDNVEPGASAGGIDIGFGREHGVDREAAVFDDDHLCPGFVQVVLEQALIIETVFDDKDAKARKVGERDANRGRRVCRGGSGHGRTFWACLAGRLRNRPRVDCEADGGTANGLIPAAWVAAEPREELTRGHGARARTAEPIPSTVSGPVAHGVAFNATPPSSVIEARRTLSRGTVEGLTCGRRGAGSDDSQERYDGCLGRAG